MQRDSYNLIFLFFEYISAQGHKNLQSLLFRRQDSGRTCAFRTDNCERTWASKLSRRTNPQTYQIWVYARTPRQACATATKSTLNLTGTLSIRHLAVCTGENIHRTARNIVNISIESCTCTSIKRRLASPPRSLREPEQRGRIRERCK